MRRKLRHRPQPVSPELAERVRAAVEGPVLGAKLVDGELWVVGGDESNHYNMDLIAAVFDIGGADTYTFSAPPRGPIRSSSTHPATISTSRARTLPAPPRRSSPSRYSTTAPATIATSRTTRAPSPPDSSALPILIDDAGDDRYVNDTPDAGWAEGVGFYGAGVLIDRAGDDRYEGQMLAQGVGGPRGIGIIIDSCGQRHLYGERSATSPAGTARRRLCGSEPGLRPGNTRLFGRRDRRDLRPGRRRHLLGRRIRPGHRLLPGLGILHDGAGNDRYLGSRYAQGSAAHQAAGILVDDAGADSYACPGPAAQGAAWDMSAAMLDRPRRRRYVTPPAGFRKDRRPSRPSAIRIDLDGRDTYSCTGACLGRSSDNTYHYDEDKLFNFSASIDRGGKIDSYPEPFSNDRARFAPASVAPDQPASSECCGLFLDD